MIIYSCDNVSICGKVIEAHIVLGGVEGVQTVAFVSLIIVSIALIAVVLLQSGRSAGLSGAISGGAEQLVGKQKARGIDAVLSQATVVLAVLFFVLTIAVAYFM
jgi:preprotein translocase subunit SecG